MELHGSLIFHGSTSRLPTPYNFGFREKTLDTNFQETKQHERFYDAILCGLELCALK
jgi:hypothetical protein